MLCSLESRIWLVLLFQSLGARGNLKLVLTISKYVLHLSMGSFKKCSCFGHYTAAILTCCLPLQSLKLANLTFHGEDRWLLQVLLVAEAAGIVHTVEKGSIVAGSDWGAAARVQLFAVGCWAKKNIQTFLWTDVCPFHCHICSIRLLSLNCFFCLTAFCLKQELCYIKVKVTTATEKGSIRTSKTVRTNTW